MPRRMTLLAVSSVWLAGILTTAIPAPLPADDFGALESALKDLLTWEDSPLRPSKKAEAPAQVLFSPAALSEPLKVDQVVGGYSRRPWNELSLAQHRRAREAAKDLVGRVKAEEPFKGFAPSDERIALFTRELKPEERGRRRPQVFRAYAPGYSRDRKVAVIRLHFPWSIHSGDGTYVLEKQGDKWVVLVRDFRYSL